MFVIFRRRGAKTSNGFVVPGKSFYQKEIEIEQTLNLFKSFESSKSSYPWPQHREPMKDSLAELFHFLAPGKTSRTLIWRTGHWSVLQNNVLDIFPGATNMKMQCPRIMLFTIFFPLQSFTLDVPLPPPSPTHPSLPPW